MDEVEFHCEPPTNVPTMVVAFGGWVDAGEAATSALRSLVHQLAATPLATIDPEEFVDFTGSVHMTQDTCGKQILPTSPSACTDKASKADVPNAANVSCSPIAILRCVRRCQARCWTLIHCVSSSSISSSCGDANIV